jgi:hypothetical protein
VPKHCKDFPDLYAHWDIASLSLDDAPSFPNDPTKNGNVRSPSYSVWTQFCQNTGLYDLFYNEQGNLHAGHPGTIGITKEDADIVSAALAKYKLTATLPPGFEAGWDYAGPANYDYDLARLIWLDWWMRWAVENCETPAIQNG